MKSNPAKKTTGQCFSREMKATCKNSANLEQKKSNQNCHLSPFMTSFFSYFFTWSKRENNTGMDYG
jgi:hypothetical protein